MENNTCMANLERDMEEIDEAILKHSMIIEGLRVERVELLARKSNCEMQEVFECVVEHGFTPGEMMELVLSSISKKKDRNSN